jgi:tetratricopeptide (TPR) repeat protein
LFKKEIAYGACLFLLTIIGQLSFAQSNPKTEKYENSPKKKIQSASRKIEAGLEKDNKDTLASGYFELGESYYEKGDLPRSEVYYKKSKDLFEKAGDPDGVARSSRALARVQEDQHKNTEAISNYDVAGKNSFKSGDMYSNSLNINDKDRLKFADSLKVQQKFSGITCPFYCNQKIPMKLWPTSTVPGWSISKRTSRLPL